MAVGPAFQQSVGLYTSSVANDELFAYTSAAKSYNGTYEADLYSGSRGMFSHHGFSEENSCVLHVLKLMA
jgi:hypothetical protein